MDFLLRYDLETDQSSAFSIREVVTTQIYKSSLGKILTTLAHPSNVEGWVEFYQKS